MKKIAIIGHGYVGDAMFRFFTDHFELCVVDPKYDDFEKKKVEANTADLAIICVPTPESADHSVDLSFIESTLNWLDPNKLVLIKSTIPPGTTDRLKQGTRKIEVTIDGVAQQEEQTFTRRLVFSPEYIGEGKYVVQWWAKNYPHPTDMKYHSFQIFGGERVDAIEVAHYFQRVLGPEAEMCFTDAKTAELCKYMENSWGATKVTFCNEFYEIAKAVGVNYEELRELWLKDGRVERMHTAVFPDARGFGGKCYPKDVNGIVEQSKKAGYTPKLLATVLSVNDEIRNVQS